MISHLIACVLMGSAFARPQTQSYSSDQSTPIPIISHSEVLGENGNFNYSYETGNGIRIDQSGYTKIIPANRQLDKDAEDQVVQVVSGSYSYQSPDGTPISLSYIADENGFQPVGEHLPTPPPIPEGIQKVLDQLPKTDETVA